MIIVPNTKKKILWGGEAGDGQTLIRAKQPIRTLQKVFFKKKKKKENLCLSEGVHVDNWGPCGPSHNNKRVTMNSELVVRPPMSISFFPPPSPRPPPPTIVYVWH